MPLTTHNIKGCNATYELMPNVIGIIEQDLEVHVLANVNED